MQGGIEQMAIDPVCHMTVDPETAPAKADYNGKTYYFCAPGCKAAFEEDPELYLKQPEHSGGAMNHGHCCGH
jgi:YHS domain-containing protein